MVRRRANTVVSDHVRLQLAHPLIQRHLHQYGYSTAYTAQGHDHEVAEAWAGRRTAALHDFSMPQPNRRMYDSWAPKEEKEQLSAEHDKARAEFDSQVRAHSPEMAEAGRYELEQHWQQGMRRALTRGHISIDEAEKRGYRSDAREHGDVEHGRYDRETGDWDGRTFRHGGWQPLPDKVFHVSTNADAVQREGLKTPAEMKRGNKSIGLGGPNQGSDVVSVTDDPKLPHAIYHSLHERHAVVTGKITPDQLLDYAKHPPVGEPFHDAIKSQHLPEFFDEAREKMKIHRGVEAPDDHPDWKIRDYHQPGAAGLFDIPHHWHRPATDDEHRENLAYLHSTFSRSRHYAGGHRDPLFISTDPHAFAKADPAKFGILHFKPHEGAQGYPLQASRRHHEGADSGEWRMGGGSPFDVESVDKPEPRHVKEFGLKREAAAKGYYHVAPQSQRSQIEEHGIDHKRGESPWSPSTTWDYPRGNYLFHGDLGSAHRYRDVLDRFEQDNGGPDQESYDIWHVHGPVGQTHEDPFRSSDDTGMAEHSVYTSDPIPAKHIRRIAAIDIGPKPEFVSPPEDADDDAFSAHMDRQRKIKNDWTRKIRHGLSMGHITPEHAKSLGHYFNGHETDNRGEPKWGPLPHTLYHVTTNLPAVREHGLKTRDELGQGRGLGLGGGESDTISYTADPEVAKTIHHSLGEFHDVLNGRKTPQHMLDEAKRGEGAERPFHKDLIGYWKSGWHEGEELPSGLQDVLHGRESKHDFMGNTLEEFQAKHGNEWQPHPNSNPRQTPKGMIHNQFTRPATPEEHRENAASMYKIFSAYREHAGGRMDPLFFGSDLEGLAKTKREDHGIVKVHPKPGAQGYQMGALGEWRSTTGDNVEVDKSHDPRTAAVDEDPIYYHGSRWTHKPGDILQGGVARPNQGAGGKPEPHVYYTTRHDVASAFADAGYGPPGRENAKPKVYSVRPVEGHEDDPDEEPEIKSYRAKKVEVLGRVRYDDFAADKFWKSGVLDEDDYRLQHGAPDHKSGAPLHDLHQMFPADVYTHPHYYRDGTDGWDDSYHHIQRTRGNPEAKVRAYRAMPAEHAHRGIRPGDWVSTSKAYARQHAMQDDKDDDWPVVSATVRAKHLFTAGDFTEYGYDGPELPAEAHRVSFKGGKNQEVRQHADGVIRKVVRRPMSPVSGYTFHHSDHRDFMEQHGPNPSPPRGRVDAYSPDDSYAGHLSYRDGEAEEVKIEPGHEHVADELERRMRMKMPKTGATHKMMRPSELEDYVPTRDDLDAPHMKPKMDELRNSILNNGYVDGWGEDIRVGHTPERGSTVMDGHKRLKVLRELGYDWPIPVRTAALQVKDYDGETGNRNHITRSEVGQLPVGAVADMHGVRGEVPGEHRNKQGQAWEDFKADIAANGIREPVFITVDHGDEPKLSEGSHRRDAAVELGLSHIPAEIRYFGHAEHQGTVQERAMRKQASKMSPMYHVSPSTNRMRIMTQGLHPESHRRIWGVDPGVYVWTGEDHNQALEEADNYGEYLRSKGVPHYDVWKVNHPHQLHTDTTGFTTHDSNARVINEHVPPEHLELADTTRKEASISACSDCGSYDADHPKIDKLYHATPPINRQSIGEKGLLTEYDNAQGAETPRGIYMGEKPEPLPSNSPVPRHYQDTWEVDTRGLKLHPDPYYEPRDGQIGNSYYTTHDIEPGRLRLHTEGDIKHPWNEHLHRWATRRTPHDRVFGPTFGLDHRLWDGEKLKEPVRADIMKRFGVFCIHHEYKYWSKWAKIVFFGSEASEWTGPGTIGNGDFDLSIGIEYDIFRSHNGDYTALPDEEIAGMFTKHMHAELNDPEHVYPGVEGVWDQTWFANVHGWDIARIKPYSAYDVVDQSWIVKPPHLPDWSAAQLPHAMLVILRAAETTARNTLKLPEPERTQQASRLYEMWHTDRSNAFGPQGEGWMDLGNLREKWLDQLDLWGPLAQAHSRTQRLQVTATDTWRARAWDKAELVPMHEFAPMRPLNAREDKHESPEYLDNLKRQVVQHGFQTPVAIMPSEMPNGSVQHEIWDGCHRHQVGKELAATHLPAVVVRSEEDFQAGRFESPSEHGFTGTPVEGPSYHPWHAARQTTAAQHDHDFGYEHGLIGAPGNKPHFERSVEKHGPDWLDGSDHDYLRGHAEGTEERARRQSERAAKGEHECPDCLGSGRGPWKGQSCKACDGSGALSEEDAHKTDTLYHVTDNPHFKPDPHHVPEDNAMAISSRERPGLFAARGEGVNHWTHTQHYVRPYIAELHVPRIAHEPGRWGGERFIPAENFDQVKVHRIIPLAAHENEYWERKPYGGPDAREMTPGQHAVHKQHALDELKNNHGFEPEDIEHLRQHWAKIAKALPKKQKCKYCSEQATQRVIHSEGMAYIPCCDQHLGEAKGDAANCTPDGTRDESNIDAVRKIAAGIPPAERSESVKHMLENYKPTDFNTWDEVRHNINWDHPPVRAFVDDVRRNGVQRPIPVDYESDPPKVMNGHSRLLAAERAGVNDVPTRQHEGWLDPDDPDHLGRGPDHPEHFSYWASKIASQGVRIFHGTTRRAADRMISGEGREESHEELAHRVEADHGLEHGAVWNHPWVQKGYIGQRAKQGRSDDFYATLDHETAKQYATVGSAPLHDVLLSAYQRLHPDKVKRSQISGIYQADPEHHHAWMKDKTLQYGGGGVVMHYDVPPRVLATQSEEALNHVRQQHSRNEYAKAKGQWPEGKSTHVGLPDVEEWAHRRARDWDTNDAELSFLDHKAIRPYLTHVEPVEQPDKLMGRTQDNRDRRRQEGISTNAMGHNHQPVLSVAR